MSGIAELRYAPTWVLHGSLFLLLFLDAGSMFIHFIRISAAEEIGHIYKISTGLALVGGAFAALMYGFRRSTASVLFIFLFVHGLCGTVLQNYNLDYHFWGHIYYWCIMFFGFHLGQTAKIDIPKLERLLVWLSRLILLGSALGFLNLESYRSSQQGNLYNGYAGDQLVFPLSVFLSFGMRWHALGAFVLILLSSRRGPLAAAVVAIVMLAVAKRVRNFWLAGTLTLVPMVIVGVLCIAAVRFVVESDTFSEDSVIVRVAQKWNRFLEYRDNATEATSGRDLEVEGALELIGKSPTDWLTGHGFGWVIEATDWHFCHVSYLNNLVTHGIILGGIQIAFILVQVKRTHRHAQQNAPESRLLWAAFTYQVSVLMLSFTAAWIAISFLFWLMLGFGSRSTQSGMLPRN